MSDLAAIDCGVRQLHARFNDAVLRKDAAAFAACGVWASSLTESQLVAGTLTLGVLLFFWILTWNQAAADPRIIAILMPLSLFDRFHTFAGGAIDTRDVVFLVLFAVFFLSMTLLTLEARRWRGVR